MVEVAGREPVGLQDRLAVQSAPLEVARSLRHVGHDHVGVQVRILGSRCAVLVGGRDEPRGALADGAARAAPYDAGFVLEVREGGLPRRRMRLVDNAPGLVVAEGVQEADALGDGEHQVEPGHRAEGLLLESSGSAGRIDSLDGDRASLRVPPPQLLAGVGVISADQRSKLAFVDGSLEAEFRGRPTDPDAR